MLRRLGPVAASNLCGGVARWVGPLLPVSRVADQNLRAAMPELDAAARRRMVRGVWDNLGRTMGELPHVASLKQAATGPGWELDGAEVMHALAAQGGPILFFSAHIGNWELLPVVAAHYGVRVSSLYRAASNPLVDQIITQLRQQAVGLDVPMFPKGAAGARQIVRHLAQGGVVGMLMDQKMNDGIEARLFGQPAMTAPALAALALRLRCPVVPAHVERLGPARFRLVCDPLFDLPNSGDRTEDIATLTQRVNDRLEEWIRARPQEWLWLHRRWPRAR